MKNHETQQRYERALARVLAQHAAQSIPATTDLWPHVRRCLAERALGQLRSRPKPRVPLSWLLRVAFVLVAGLLVTGVGWTAATAAAPRFCVGVPAACQRLDALAQSISVALGGAHQAGTDIAVASSPQGAAIALDPPPPFPVAAPTYLPKGLTLHGSGYLPPHVPGRPAAPAAVGSMDAPSPQEAQASAEQRVAQWAKDAGSVVWLRYASPAGDRVLEITEQEASPGQHSPPGQALQVGGFPASLRQQQNQTTLVVVRAGTIITITTNLGPGEATKVAGSLQNAADAGQSQGR